MTHTPSLHGTFHAIRETDETITVGSPAIDRLHRSRMDYDCRTLLDQSLRAFRLNPLARRIVKLYRYFSLGTNVTIEVKGRPSSLFRRMAYGTTTNVYLFKDIYVTQLLGNTTNFFTPARVGFYFAKQAAGSTGRIAGFYRYGDNFS